ncbi:unnamed protein product, partial [Chrysoparadoxa australica]
MVAGLTLDEGEASLLEVQALLKKCIGTAVLTRERLVWLATDAQATVQRREIRWSNLKDFQVSPAKSPKVMIKLVGQGEGASPIVLQFTGEGAADVKEAVRRTILEGQGKIRVVGGQQAAAA